MQHRVFINYTRRVRRDHVLSCSLEEQLRQRNCYVFRDETDLIPSQEWPTRLENEVRQCHLMLSLISNSSLQSNWCMNEIDLAKKLGKRILPVVTEKIGPSLEFRVFNPRFMSIQYHRTPIDWEPDVAQIVELVCRLLSDGEPSQVAS